MSQQLCWLWGSGERYDETEGILRVNNMTEGSRPIDSLPPKVALYYDFHASEIIGRTWMLWMRHHSFVSSEAGASHQDREVPLYPSNPSQTSATKAIAASSALTSAKEWENMSKERTREKDPARFEPIVASLRTNDQVLQRTDFLNGNMH